MSAIRERAQVARSCYEAALRRTPDLEGRLLVTLQLGDDGRPCRVWVSSATMSIDDGFSRCLERALDVRYPAPVAGCIDVVLPLSFERETGGLKNGTLGVGQPLGSR